MKKALLFVASFFLLTLLVKASTVNARYSCEDQCCESTWTCPECQEAPNDNFCKEGYCKDEYSCDYYGEQEEWSCSCPSAEPSPSIEPTPNPRTSVSSVDPHCDGGVTLRMTLTDNDKKISGVKVTFTYRGETKTADTNSDGNAEVGFTYSGDENAKITADGFPGQEPPVRSAQNCQSITDTGKVLGATTMAATNSLDLGTTIVSTGALLSFVGSSLFLKKRN